MSILIQSPVAHFGKPEPPLDNVKLMFTVKVCPKFSDGSNVIFVKDSDLTSYQ